MENQIFEFRVRINMTAAGLQPSVELHKSAVNVGVHEAKVLEDAVADYMRDWLAYA